MILNILRNQYSTAAVSAPASVGLSGSGYTSSSHTPICGNGTMPSTQSISAITEPKTTTTVGSGFSVFPKAPEQQPQPQQTDSTVGSSSGTQDDDVFQFPPPPPPYSSDVQVRENNFTYFYQIFKSKPVFCSLKYIRNLLVVLWR